MKLKLKRRSIRRTDWLAPAIAVAIFIQVSDAQGQSHAKIRRTSFQESTSQETKDVANAVQDVAESSAQRPQGLTPTTGLVTEARLNSIQERISLIKKMVEEDKARAEAAKQRAMEAIVAKPEPPVKPEPIEPEPDPATDPTAKDDSEKDDTKKDEAKSGTQVVGQPVNPFKLASSLFRTGNIKESRKSYEVGLSDATSDEQAWLLCFIGCCYRLEGNFGESEATFRKLLNSRSQSYATEYAKWSLEYLETRRNSAVQFQQIALEIDEVITALKSSKE